jgi:hypothetical protein
MKKNLRSESKNNQRTNRRVVMVKSVKGKVLSSPRDGETFRAQLINVSSTGSQIYSNKSIENNSMVSLELGSLDGSHSVSYPGKLSGPGKIR